MKIFLGFCFNIAKQKVFFRARYLVMIYTQKEAHSRFFVTGESVFAQQMLAKKNSFSGRQASSLCTICRFFEGPVKEPNHILIYLHDYYYYYTH